jgi:hypothetical protein
MDLFGVEKPFNGCTWRKVQQCLKCEIAQFWPIEHLSRLCHCFLPFDLRLYLYLGVLNLPDQLFLYLDPLFEMFNSALGHLTDLFYELGLLFEEFKTGQGATFLFLMGRRVLGIRLHSY